MLDRLLASAAPRERRVTAAFVAVSAHAALVTGAVLGTARIALSEPTLAPDTLVWVVPPDRGQIAQPLAPPVGAVGIDPATIADVLPIDLPSLGTDVAFQPWLGPPVPGFNPGGVPVGSGPGTVLPAALADEPPQLLAGPPLEYPPLLRAARVEGRVLVEAVVDTTGRAEPVSIRVVQSAHPGFEPVAVAFLRGALFRPARAYGRGVRVLVRVPVEFRLR
jgi:TonB family protein